ncbi:hypothetical protein CRG98_014261 [Punica granatum]|uniref:DUF7745 domain-containing protein n=1 Tax=Punica granatum TaxID=22663 RepID=A0A2I0KC58_PUNGR|nr:hypothetical protein CRG98_014261 [Punica granatum]
MRAPTRVHIRVRTSGFPSRTLKPCINRDRHVGPKLTSCRQSTQSPRTFRPVDRAFLRLIVGDLPLLADSPIDWTLLRTTISFWDTQRAVFSFQGTELVPTVEEYATLIQRPMPTRDIVVPNQIATIQSRLAILLGLRDKEIRHELRPFCSSHPFSYITDKRSLIVRLLQVFRPSDRDYTDWKQFMEGLTPVQFLWAARWNPGGPMTIGCPSITRLPLISHLGSTLIFPARVIRQLGGLQDIPIEADCAPYRFMWADTTASLPNRFLRASQADIPDAESSIRGAMRTELQSIREERDRLRCELVDTHSELTDHRELQRELAQTRARVVNQDREIARLSATLDQAQAKKRKVSHP